MFKECTYSPSRIWRITIHFRQFSLKIHYVDFNITICPCIVYVENLMSEITKRPHNCVQIIIQLFVSRYCSPKITLKMKSIFDINISANVKKLTWEIQREIRQVVADVGVWQDVHHFNGVGTGASSAGNDNFPQC